ncbi:hypothetical protein DYB32_008460 [Aphanomyces invadans]|uniref:AMP-dependent synthetase/ligase domain-containing protein n=1 Tax=Aphanomyces invadans TaxID=157072 RepID=A0A3R6VGP9_9STRA|nr:hypothetical protein DYB32_008460 [Aphanomyces invadans]
MAGFKQFFRRVHEQRGVTTDASTESSSSVSSTIKVPSIPATTTGAAAASKVKHHASHTNPAWAIRTFDETNIVAILQRRARDTPHVVVYTFLDDKGRETSTLTYAEVDAGAKQVAALLQTQHKHKFQPGDRVVLCYPPGHDFTVAFWGCLYAGAIAVAVYPPHPLFLQKDLPRFNVMVRDTNAHIVLTNSKYRNMAKLGAIKSFLTIGKKHASPDAPSSPRGSGRKDDLTKWPEHLKWFKTDKVTVPAAAFDASYVASLDPSNVAFFQYTSGSTEDPRALGWLPPYHDNGLLAFNLMPIYVGNKSVQMSPIAFIKDPSIWMRMVSKYKAGYTCGPNFAYLLAAKRTSDEVAASLDLTSLRNAACGAEPIKPAFLALFADKFKRANFHAGQFNCALGMAEATLVVTGYPDADKRGPPKTLVVDRTILEEHHRFEVISNGTLAELGDKTSDVHGSAHFRQCIHFTGLGYFGRTYDLRIVDPVTLDEVPESHVGEIWIHGPSMAQQYWNRPDLTRERLHATLRDDRTTHYVRTNDLGVVLDGELFFVGRMSDMIAMDNRWVSPQTIEDSVERASDYIRPGCVSCFTLPVESCHGSTSHDPALIIVAELKHDMKTVTNGQAIVASICRAVWRQIWFDNHLQAATIVLIQPKSVPKTTSGKLQRWRARHMFTHDQLRVQCVYNHSVATKVDKSTRTVAEWNEVMAQAFLTTRNLSRVAPADDDSPTRRRDGYAVAV